MTLYVLSEARNGTELHGLQEYCKSIHAMGYLGQDFPRSRVTQKSMRCIHVMGDLRLGQLQVDFYWAAQQGRNIAFPG